MQTKTKRIFYSAAALIVAAALAVGGTFAFRGVGRKANTMGGKAKYQAHLVENFPTDQEWKEGGEITKEVSVKNMGNTPQFQGKNWGDIYVRVQLWEYLDITKVNYLYFAGEGETPLPLVEGNDPEPTPLMIGKDGEFVRLTEKQFATFASASTPNALVTKLKAAYAWANVLDDTSKRDAFLLELATDMLANTREWVKISGLFDVKADGTDEFYYYLPTQAGDPNGQYGAYLSVERNNATADVLAGDHRVDYALGNHEDYVDDNYELHLWDNECECASHGYLDFKQNASVWITLAAWELLSDADKSTTYKWILDPTTGWATWSQALPAWDGVAGSTNNETKKLIEAILPKVDLEDEIYYDLYVHMEACSLSEMTLDWPIYKAPSLRAVAQTSAIVAPGGTVTFKSFLGAGTGNDVTDGTTWTLSKTLPSGVSLFGIGTPNTTTAGSKLTAAPGLVTLTVGATESDGPLYVIAEYNGQKGAVEVTVQSTPIDPAPVITAPTLPGTATVGTAYPVQNFTADSTTPVTWELEGNSPPGLMIDPDTGILSGTPTAAGTYKFKVKATNNTGSTTTDEITIVVSPAAPTSLDVNPNGPDGKPHQPKGSEETAEDIQTNFYPFGYFSDSSRVINLTHSSVAGGDPHYGGIQLADIINGSTTGIDIDYAELNDPRFTTETLYIGEVHGVPCIVWAYAPTSTEFYDFLDTGLSDEYFWIDLTIPLTNGTLTGSVNVRMMYSCGSIWADV